MNHVVKSADRVLDLIETFAAAKRPLSISDLAERLEAPISSCHGLVHTLLQRGYLYGLGARKAVYPTRRLLAAAEVIDAHDPLVERLRHEMERLRDETRETVILGKRQGDAAVYLEIKEGLQTIRYTAGVGELKPLHSSAIGKAILSGLDDDALGACLARLDLARVTENTKTDPAALFDEIARGRDAGYQTTRGENVSDVMAFAVPLIFHGDDIGIVVAGPIHRMAENESAIVGALLDFQSRLALQEAA